MITVLINENTPAGKRILNEIADNPQIGQISTLELNSDASSELAGYVTVDEYFSTLRETVRRKHQERQSVKD